MKEYIKTGAEGLPRIILNNIVDISDNADVRRILIRDTDLGISFFQMLNLYVKARHNYVEQLLQASKVSLNKPLSSIKMVLEAVKREEFPITHIVSIQGFSYEALKEGLEQLILGGQKVRKALKKRLKRVLPEIVTHLLKKNSFLKKLEETLLNEIIKNEGKCRIEEVVRRRELVQTELEVKLRVIGVLRLLKNGNLLYDYKENIVKVKRYE